MKRLINRIIAILFCALVLLMSGCDPNEHKTLDRSLMIGYWQSGTVYEYYNGNGTGYTWDTADDVTEEEAQPFSWTLSETTLTQNHQIEMGGVVPKRYTVTTLNSSVLCYHDDYGNNYIFNKRVPER